MPRNCLSVRSASAWRNATNSLKNEMRRSVKCQTFLMLYISLPALENHNIGCRKHQGQKKKKKRRNMEVRFHGSIKEINYTQKLIFCHFLPLMSWRAWLPLFSVKKQNENSLMNVLLIFSHAVTVNGDWSF